MMCLASTAVREVVITQRSMCVSVEAEVALEEVDEGEKAEGADSRNVERRSGCN